ncbi:MULTISPECIES: serine/threonine-protein kinase [unclassified Streptomyces]|uniref:serine/threonine-protein kinase n=1 Tax=unclassified Streptomyces TaxID=2593676 RepID=UPI002DDA0088|nr:serine/threonine-protein kinase [Streptomyces sp. NBC_01237]WRZ73433.1 serine/threonine protein kinase [Streptomyces sp. NBC_01237]
MDQLTHDDPSHIGPYRLLARLGAGGMGEVYLARSAGGRTVAVKLVRSELATEPEFRRRFAQEVAAARRVGGEWTAPVLDADTDAPAPWVATGYVPGPSLHAVIAGRTEPLPERSVRILAHRLAQALTAVHSAGLIHRDLKPANILVTIDGPRVIDFGIARALDAVTADGKLTRTGAVIGSPGYMSPEQVRGETLTPVSDVFSLGSVLAFAATRRQPFGTSTSGMHAVMFRIAQEEPDLSGLPAGLAELVRDCLAKDPADRPTPAEVVARTTDATDGADGAEPWLPGTLIAELGRRAAELLDSEAPKTRLRSGPPAPSAAPTPPPPTAPPTASVPLAAAPPAPSAPPPPVSPAPVPPGTPPSGAPAAEAPAAPETPAPGVAQAPQAPHAAPSAPPGPTPPPPLGVFGAPTPVSLTTEPRPARGRRTTLTVAAVVAAVALLAGGLTYAAMNGGEDDDGDKRNSAGDGKGGSASDRTDPSADPSEDGKTPVTASPGPSVSAAVEGVIGKEYLGTWQGSGKNGDGDVVSFRRITITQGSEGADVATTFNSFDDVLCTGAAELVSFDNLMVLESRKVSSIPEEGCSDGGKQTLRAHDNGTLIWTSGDGDESVVLSRAAENSAPIPAGFLGTWKYVNSGTDGDAGPGETTTLVLSQGAYGEVVAKYTGDGPAYHCEWESVLVDANSNGLRLGPRVVTAAEPEDQCEAGNSRTVRMKGADGLSLTWLGEDAEPSSYRRAG